MEGKLIFCSDAILRFQSDYDETSAVPLLSIQNTIANTDQIGRASCRERV